jgi:asparagine synthetase B (glutamine-hydrolysing)
MEIRYNRINSELFVNSCRVTEYNYLTVSNEIVSFLVNDNVLFVRIPFLLLDNIFFYETENEIVFSNCIEDLASDFNFDSTANDLLNEIGFLPHGKTQFSGVYVFCSFLTYEFQLNKTLIDLNFPHIYQSQPASVDDLYYLVFEKIDKTLRKRSGKNIILPLSGGMDSRLLLDFLLKFEILSNVKIYTHGVPESGDVLIAKDIINNLNLNESFYFFDLNRLTNNDIYSNYRKAGYLNPIDRLLTMPLEKQFEHGLVLSGLYGDVIFSDNNKFKKCAYIEFLEDQNIVVTDFYDKMIVNAYNRLPPVPKLYQLLLRAQKLTRMSFTVSEGFNFYTPFVDIDVVFMASNVNNRDFYSKLIKRHMNIQLRNFIHQSTLSYFYHPWILRRITLIMLTVLHSKYRIPYFSSLLLKKLKIQKNFAPIPNLSINKSGNSFI